MTKELNEEKVIEMVKSASIDELYKQIIRLRYGIGMPKAATAKEIGKRLNLKGMKLREEIEKAERLAFNILKTESLYDIIIQNQIENDDGNH